METPAGLDCGGQKRSLVALASTDDASGREGHACIVQSGLAGDLVARHGQIIERAERVLKPFQRLQIAGAATAGGEQVGEELGGVAQALGADAQVMAGLGVQVGEVAGAVFDLMMQAAQGLDGEGI